MSKDAIVANKLGKFVAFWARKPLSVLMVRQEPSRFEPRWLLSQEGLTLSCDVSYCCQVSWRFGLGKPLSVLIVSLKLSRFEPRRLLFQEG